MINIYGPPTPKVYHVMTKGILKNLVRVVAWELMFYDLSSSGKDPAYILYEAKSKHVNNKQSLGDDDRKARREFLNMGQKASMIFMLSEKNRPIFEKFDLKLAQMIEPKHL